MTQKQTPARRALQTLALLGLLALGSAWAQSRTSCEIMLTNFPVAKFDAQAQGAHCMNGLANGVGLVTFTWQGTQNAQWGQFRAGRAIGIHLRYAAGASRYALVNYDANGIFQTDMSTSLPGFADDDLVRFTENRSQAITLAGVSQAALLDENRRWRSMSQMTIANLTGGPDNTIAAANRSSTNGNSAGRDDPKVFGRSARGG